MTPRVLGRSRTGPAAVALLCFAIALLAYQGSLLRTRTFDPDEFQHAHSAFLIAQGQLPYRDYFEHHPPLLHFLMAPVIASLDPQAGGTQALETLVVLRALSWIAALFGLFAHHLLALRLAGPLGASVSSLLLVTTVMVFEKSMEIRPDTFAFALLQWALLILCGQGSTPRPLFPFMLLGVGLLFTQKLAFPILGIVLAVTLGQRPWTREHMKQGLWMLGGLLGPTLLCGLYFVVRSAGTAFIEDVFLINLRWKARLDAWPFLVSRFLTPNPLFALTAALALLDCALRMRRGPRDQGDDSLRVVALSASSGALGVVLLPVAWEQYYLIFLPSLSTLAGDLIERAGARVSRSLPAVPSAAIVSVFVSLGSLLPALEALTNQRLRTSEAKDKAIALILDNASRSETVLDGYSGIGVFRPHAFRYFFLHAEMRLMLEESTVKELEEGLLNGSINPRFASSDSHLRSVSPRVREYLERHFATVEQGPAAIRLFPGPPQAWDDGITRFLGQSWPARGAWVMALDGWLPRESPAGRSFRRSRGKASTLLFSVLDPEGETRLCLSARAGVDVPLMSARVRLNEEDLGEIQLASNFASFELLVRPGLLVRGLNRLEFFYPRRPAQSRPELTAEENATMALESLALVRTGSIRANEKGRAALSP
jgi:hypothetical protein